MKHATKLNYIIDSVEFSEMFSKKHNDVLKNLEDLAYELVEYWESMFIDATREVRGKKYPTVRMTMDGFLTLSNTRSLSKGKNAAIKAEFLNKHGVPCRLVLTDKKRGEDEFYEMLTTFFRGHKVYREYPVCGYFIDFYVGGIYVEYDEEHHLQDKVVEQDKKRWGIIKKHLQTYGNPQPELVRVNKGEEIKGLADINDLVI